MGNVQLLFVTHGEVDVGFLYLFNPPENRIVLASVLVYVHKSP